MPSSIIESIDSSKSSDVASSAIRSALPQLRWPLNTQRFIEQALASNTDLNTAKLRVQEAGAINAASRANLLPQLDLSVANSRDRSAQARPKPELGTVAAREKRLQARLAFNWELDLFGLQRTRAKATSAQQNALAAQARAVRQSIAAQLQSALISALAAQRQMLHTEKLLAILSEIETLQQALVDAGLTSRSELLRVRAERLSRRADAERVTTERTLQTLRLRALSDQSLSQIAELLAQSHAVQGCSIAVQALPISSLLTRPDVQAAEQSLIATQMGAKAAQLARLPIFALTGELASQESRQRTLSDLLQRVNQTSMGLSLAQSLFAGGRLKAEASAAKTRAEIAEQDYRNVLLSAAEELDSALAQVHQANQIGTQLKQALDDSKAQLSMSTARFAAGIDSRLQHLEQQRELIERRLIYIDANADQCLAKVSLARAVAQAWAENSTLVFNN